MWREYGVILEYRNKNCHNSYLVEKPNKLFSEKDIYVIVHRLKKYTSEIKRVVGDFIFRAYWKVSGPRYYDKF
jgi:hypothetical protein